MPLLDNVTGIVKYSNKHTADWFSGLRIRSVSPFAANFPRFVTIINVSSGSGAG
jgi:hypothetical protein